MGIIRFFGTSVFRRWTGVENVEKTCKIKEKSLTFEFVDDNIF
jgi:hypothetical protein